MKIVYIKLKNLKISAPVLFYKYILLPEGLEFNSTRCIKMCKMRDA